MTKETIQLLRNKREAIIKTLQRSYRPTNYNEQQRNQLRTELNEICTLII